MIATKFDFSPLQRTRAILYSGGATAILASTCHHISFLLFAFGISESKISYIVTLTDQTRPFLIVISLVALFVSYLYLWQSSDVNKADTGKIFEQINITDKIFFICLVILTLIVLMLPYFTPCIQ